MRRILCITLIFLSLSCAAFAETTVLITAAGDCTLGGEVKSGIDKRFAKSVEKNGVDWFMENVREIFSADDFTLVNLEGPLTETGKKRSKLYVMRGEPSYTGILSGSSVEVANLANNHTLDFGEEGYNATLEALEEASIAVCDSEHFYIAQKDEYKIGFIGFEKWNDTENEAIEAVREARSQCDLLIVSVHWGVEYKYKANKSQKKLGRALIDAGADLVIGTHPHVVQGIEQYNGKYIVYSLGNFCFGGNTNPKDKNCYIFQQQFVLSETGAADDGIRVIPCSISSTNKTNNYQPTPLTGKAYDKCMAKIKKLSKIDGAKCLDE